MRKIEVIREKLEQALAPLKLKILDESSHHAGHSGAGDAVETHFRIEIVSHKFDGITRVARHRLVYAALQGAFDEGLHALEVYARAPGEKKPYI